MKKESDEDLDTSLSGEESVLWVSSICQWHQSDTIPQFSFRDWGLKFYYLHSPIDSEI